MKTIFKVSVFMTLVTALAVAACENTPAAAGATQTKVENQAKKPNTGGYNSQVAWGKHLVTVGLCEDCHSPKVMTAHGPVPDTSRTLSGHPAGAGVPDLVRDQLQIKGWAATNEHLTAWAGPWGISFAANLTPDDTGIGSWTEQQFFTAIRKGKSKGMESSRPLLPPMPWPNISQMSDDELKAVFAYLKSLKPIRNAVPNPIAPVDTRTISAVGAR